VQDSFYHFRWEVPDQGYRWDAEARTVGDVSTGPCAWGPFLVEQPGSREARVYNPLDPPKTVCAPLFARFSALGGDLAKILTFANEYGWLGIPELLNKTGQGVYGESLARWRHEIRDLRAAVRVWQALQSNTQHDREFLRSVFSWNRAIEAVRADIEGYSTWLAVREDSPDLYDCIISNETLVPAWAAKAFLAVTVNAHLAPFTERAAVTPCLLFSDRHRTLSAYLRPRHLLGALWLQCYQAISSERPVRQCAACRELMEVPTGSRSTKVLHDRCSNTKRMTAYRRRQRQANAFAARGMSIKQIAAALKTDATTVKKWIAQRKEAPCKGRSSRER
jgi:DNA-binding NarL/FixJ family response regulator